MKRIILGLALLCVVRCPAQVAMMKLDDIPGDRLVCVTNWGPYVTSSIAGMQNVITNMASTQYVASVISPLTRSVLGLEAHTNNADIHLTAEQRQRIAAALTNETDAAALAALSGHAANTNLHLTAEQRQRIEAASAHIAITNGDPHGVLPQAASQAAAIMAAWASTGTVWRWGSSTDWCVRGESSITNYRVSVVQGVSFPTNWTSANLKAFAGQTWVLPSTKGPLSALQIAGTFRLFTNELELAYFFNATNAAGFYTGWTSGSADDAFPPQWAWVAVTNSTTYILPTQSVESSISAWSASRTLTLNGQPWGLNSNGVFTVISSAGLTTNDVDARVALGVATLPLPGGNVTNWPYYTPFTGAVTPASGTATVAVATGSQPSLMITSPTVIQLDPTGFPTTGVCRVSLNFYSGTNAVTFATNVVTYATTPTVSTSCWNTVLFRRTVNCTWKGVGL